MRTRITNRSGSGFSCSALAAFIPLMLLFAQSVFAQAEVFDAAGAKLIRERPNSDGAATVVDIGVYVFDVDSIDDANQSFSIDMFATVSWNDPRLALPERKRGGLYRRVSLDEIWWPRGLIVNERGLTRLLPYMAEVDDLGNVRYQQRLIGELAVDLDFAEFPFDSQMLPIDFVSYANPVGDVKFSARSEKTGDDGSFGIEGWRLAMLEPQAGEFQIPGQLKPNPRLTFFIGAERDNGYYLLTMFLPMSLIILMAWSVFWLQPDIIPPRIGISTAAIFSFVAFGFTVRSNLPEVSYMTRADVFVTGCTLLVFLALGVAVEGSRLANAGRMDEALRMSAIARWAYLLLFALVVLLTFVI